MTTFTNLLNFIKTPFSKLWSTNPSYNRVTGSHQVAKSLAVVIELRGEQPRSDGWHKLKDVVILSVTVQGISVDAVDLGARMLYLKEKRSFPMYNHHFVLVTFNPVLFQYDKRASCILNQVLMCLYVCNSRHWYSHVMVDSTQYLENAYVYVCTTTRLVAVWTLMINLLIPKKKHALEDHLTDETDCYVKIIDSWHQNEKLLRSKSSYTTLSWCRLWRVNGKEGWMKGRHWWTYFQGNEGMMK